MPFDNPFSKENEKNGKKVDFNRETDELKKLLVKYEDEIERIEGIQRRLLIEPNFSEIELLEAQSTHILDRSNKMAVELRERIKFLESGFANNRARYGHVENLKKQFMTLIRKFQIIGATFKRECEEDVVRQYRTVDEKVSDDQIQDALLNDNLEEIFSNISTMDMSSVPNKKAAEAALYEVQVRRRQMNKVDQTIVDLSQLFQEMEVVVPEQEVEVEHNEEDSLNSEEELDDLNAMQRAEVKRARRQKKIKWATFLILVGICIVLALVLGIYFGTHH